MENEEAMPRIMHQDEDNEDISESEAWSLKDLAEMKNLD